MHDSYNLQCSVYSLHYTLYSVHCTVYSVQDKREFNSLGARLVGYYISKEVV